MTVRTAPITGNAHPGAEPASREELAQLLRWMMRSHGREFLGQYSEGRWALEIVEQIRARARRG